MSILIDKNTRVVTQGITGKAGMFHTQRSRNYANGKASTGFETRRDTAGEGPLDGYEAYLAAQRSYPADSIPPQVTDQAAQTFDPIVGKDLAEPSGGFGLVRSIERQSIFVGGLLKQTVQLVGPTHFVVRIGTCRIKFEHFLPHGNGIVKITRLKIDNSNNVVKR